MILPQPSLEASTPLRSAPLERIQGIGEMADLVRKKDWSLTPLGAVETWPDVLVAMVNNLLLSPFSWAIYWGDELSLIYNDVYRAFLGEKHPASLGENGSVVWQEAWPSIGPAIEGAYLKGVVTAESEVLIPILFRGKLEDRWWSYSFVPIFDNGRIAGVSNPGSENTAAVLGSRKLQESEARATRVLSSIGDAVIVTDVQMCITEMNPVAEQLTGWSQKNAVGRKLVEVFRIVDETTRQPVEDPAAKVKRLNKTVGLANHTILLAKDGREIAVDDSGAPIRNDAGDLTGIVLVFRDVSEELARERLTHDNERRLQTFVDSIPALAWMANADGWITWYNRRWYEYTGTTPAQMEGWGWQSVHDQTMLPSVMEKWTQSIKTRTPFEMVFPLRGSDGVLRPFLTRIIPVRDEKGSVIQWFGTNTEIDELQRTRDALEESERLSRRVLQSIGDAVIVTDAETKIRQMNPVAEDLTGWTVHEALGRPLSEVFHIVSESTRTIVESPADKVKRTGTVAALASHTVLLSRSSTEIAIDDSAAPIRDEEGALVGIVLVFRNIEERRRAERDRQRLDERLELALSAANGIGIWDWNVPGDLVYTDENFARMYGVDPADAAKGISIAAFTANIHPGDVDRVSSQISIALQSGRDFASEYRLSQSDGSVRWVFANGRCSFDQNGSPLRFPGVTVDITERIATESALRRSEESLRVAMETARLGSWEVDLITEEMECSDLCKADYGRGVGEPFSYADLLECVHPDDQARMRLDVKQAIESHTIYRCEYRIVWPDQSLHWVIASGRVSYGPKDEPLKITGVSLDVTERHQAHTALMQTEKLAAVGRLAASIAHEINNPLESVTNLLYLARGSHEQSEIQNYLATAERELRRVSVISNQTLRFYKQSTNARTITCHELFDSVLSIYQGRLVNSNISVEKRKRANRSVECFEGEIRQVINNLVANAVDAMHGTGGRLLVRSRDTRDWKTGREGIALTVADVGAGMSPGVMKKIFDAFFTTKGIGGTGLGLWVSKEIIDRHEGTLRVRSSQQTDRSGTVFVVFLPYDSAGR